ncbi:hypothetical protein BU24DRAFT_414188 [Aaosphaeria arxii CBS 175.79]|uniref:Uncharacterized protein n=1 Tax=Aaosphaeria arxii CBS 175.79 TaxID=1450172 RepID=A0A6A5XCL0_9PLEO|nr:uncharacterized protein BU24DRAFT_414188 [Aaosphaeria arxii CBS 175.79]KAF2010623.1 hypothetical protein BU24DRAFT_414188 [Aaosphaeria arxii CBS 175.79]
MTGIIATDRKLMPQERQYLQDDVRVAVGQKDYPAPQEPALVSTWEDELNIKEVLYGVSTDLDREALAGRFLQLFRYLSKAVYAYGAGLRHQIRGFGVKMAVEAVNLIIDMYSRSGIYRFNQTAAYNLTHKLKVGKPNVRAFEYAGHEGFTGIIQDFFLAYSRTGGHVNDTPNATSDLLNAIAAVEFYNSFRALSAAFENTRSKAYRLGQKIVGPRPFASGEEMAKHFFAKACGYALTNAEKELEFAALYAKMYNFSPTMILFLPHSYKTRIRKLGIPRMRRLVMAMAMPGHLPEIRQQWAHAGKQLYDSVKNSKGTAKVPHIYLRTLHEGVPRTMVDITSEVDMHFRTVIRSAPNKRKAAALEERF